MPNQIIGLHGLPRSGKDSIAKMLISVHNFERMAFADPLKAAAAHLLDRPLAQCHGTVDGFDREAIMPEWGFSMRWFLQILGTECMRQQVRHDFWINRMETAVRKAQATGDSRIVITDVRFQNEADFVRDAGGKMIEVRRPGLAPSSHVSDTRIECDFTIYNDSSLDDLFRKVAHYNACRL
jgi:hypothetical protein